MSKRTDDISVVKQICRCRNTLNHRDLARSFSCTTRLSCLLRTWGKSHLFQVKMMVGLDLTEQSLIWKWVRSVLLWPNARHVNAFKHNLTQICDTIYLSPWGNLWALPLKISFISPDGLYLFPHPSPGVWIWSHGSARRVTPDDCHTVKKQPFESVASATLSASLSVSVRVLADRGRC